MKEKNLLSLRNITMATGLIAVLLLAACGDDDSGSASSPEKIEVVSSIYNLGNCSKSNEGDTVFVKDKKMDYICESGDWKPVEEESSSGKNSSSSADDAGSSDGSQSGEDPVKDKSISGVSQKGPFVKGSTVTAYELDGSKSLLQTGRTFSGSISQDDGHFNLSNVTLKSSYVRLSANGYYRNEVTGKNSNAPITLNAVTDLSSRNTVNVNLLTHLEYDRVARLMAESDGTLKIKDAKKQAEKEIFEAFHIDAAGFGFSEDLDVFGNTEADAALLAISIMLQGDRSESELTELLTDLSADLSDGKWDDSVTRTEIADWAFEKEVYGSTFRENVASWGLLTNVPDFEKYMRYFWTGEKNRDCALKKEGELVKIPLPGLRNRMEGENIYTHFAYLICSENGVAFSIDGELVDNRDGKRYRTVKIGGSWWMAENLNFEYKVGDSTYGNHCIMDDCEANGRFYTWSAAMDSAGVFSLNGKGCGYNDSFECCSPQMPVRGVCPEGWHVPEEDEWGGLAVSIGGVGYVLMTEKGEWFDGNEAFFGLKTKTIDPFRFSALPVGYETDSGRDGVCSFAMYWSATEEKNGGCGRFISTVNFIKNLAVRQWTPRTDYNLAVRCIKD